MVSLKIFLVLVFAHYVISGEIVTKHCTSESEDFAKCVVDIKNEYFRKHSEGFPEHGIKGVDPLTIPELIEVDDDLGFKSVYKNIKVTGFKDVVFSDYKVDKKIKNVEFVMKVNIAAEGITVGEMLKGKTFPGTFKYEGHVKADVKYSYTEEKVNNDVVVYNIGPETITCEADNVKGNFYEDEPGAFEKDPDTQALNAEFQKPGVEKEYNERIICKIATVVFKEAVDIIRIIGKIGV